MTTAKRPANRPRLEPGLQKRRQILLSDRLDAIARKIGDGKLSAGVRKALEAYPNEH